MHQREVDLFGCVVKVPREHRHYSASERKDAVKAIKYLNQKAGKNFNPEGQRNQRWALDRLHEGLTLAQLELAVDAKVQDWGRDPQRRKYLRPSTVFGGKCEQYANEALPPPVNWVPGEEPLRRFGT